MTSLQLNDLIMIIHAKSLIFLTLFAYTNGENNITIAALIPVTGDWPVGKTIIGALAVAAEDINTNSNLLPDHYINFRYKDTNCHDGTGLGDAIDFKRELKDDFTVIIGDGCDSVCETVGLLASHWKIPIITWGCGSALLTNMTYYDTLARTVGPYPRTVQILKELLQHNKWKRLSILTSEEPEWSKTAEYFKADLEAENIKVHKYHTFESEEDHTSVLQGVIDGSRTLLGVQNKPFALATFACGRTSKPLNIVLNKSMVCRLP